MVGAGIAWLVVLSPGCGVGCSVLVHHAANDSSHVTHVCDASQGEEMQPCHVAVELAQQSLHLRNSAINAQGCGFTAKDTDVPKKKRKKKGAGIAYMHDVVYCLAMQSFS